MSMPISSVSGRGALTPAIGLLPTLVGAGEAWPADGGLGPGAEAADGADDPGHGFEVAGARDV